MAGRFCTSCGTWYSRVNRVRMWTERNVGHREGWRVEEARLCNACAPVTMVTRVMQDVGVALIGRQKKRSNVRTLAFKGGAQNSKATPKRRAG